MKTLVRTLVATLGLATMVVAPLRAQGALKFAFIDSRVVLDKAPGRAAAESTFQKEDDVAQSKIKRMQDTLQAMVSAYQKSQGTLTPVTKELREKEINDKQQSYQTAAQLLDAQMQQRQGELVQPMMAQIRQTLEAIRKEDGYSFIFDVGANSSVVVAADSALDITDKVIGRLKPIPITAAGTRPETPKPGTVLKAQPAGVVPKKPPTL
ncbi:MAG: OmpH family outer membrane protein [Gemmatimonadaceae bacterium]